MVRRLVWVGVLAVMLVGGVAAVGGGAENGFADDDGSVHEPALGALGWTGVVAGTECGPAAICPEVPLDRWTMAVWLARARQYPYGDLWRGLSFADWRAIVDVYMEAPLHERDPVEETRFADVDAADWRATYVEAVAANGIVSGCRADPPEFCPDWSVTRGQVAAVLVRAFNLEGADAALAFTDIAGDAHEVSIRQLASAGVTVGCATEPLRFCPGAPVTRGEMATFLVRAMGRAWALPDPNPGDTVDCEDFETQGEAQVFFDSYYLYYGDVAMLDDGDRPLVACESLPATPWRYLKVIDSEGGVSPWVGVWAATGGAAARGQRAHLGVDCGQPFLRLGDGPVAGDRVSVEFEFHPGGEPSSESWAVSREGADTFLLMGFEGDFYQQLWAGGGEELRIRVGSHDYRFGVADYAAALDWLSDRCMTDAKSDQGGWPYWTSPGWA